MGQNDSSGSVDPFNFRVVVDQTLLLGDARIPCKLQKLTKLKISHGFSLKCD